VLKVISQKLALKVDKIFLADKPRSELKECIEASELPFHAKPRKVLVLNITINSSKSVVTVTTLFFVHHYNNTTYCKYCIKLSCNKETLQSQYNISKDNVLLILQDAIMLEINITESCYSYLMISISMSSFST